MDVQIRLRPVTVDDIDDEYCRWYTNDDGHLNFFTGSGRVFTREVLLEDFERGRQSGGWFYYLIESHDGARIGNVKVGPIDARNKTSDLVCLIGNRAFVGKRLANQAVAAASELAFTKHGIRRLHSGMYATNVSSIKAYTRAGWFIECTMRGFYLVGDQPIDRVCVACLNPRLFTAGIEG